MVDGWPVSLEEEGVAVVAIVQLLLPLVAVVAVVQLLLPLVAVVAVVQLLLPLHQDG